MPQQRIVVTLLIDGGEEEVNQALRQVEHYAEALPGVAVERRAYRGSSSQKAS